MIEKLKQIDTEIFLYLNNLGVKEWDWFWVFITEKETSMPLYAILLFLVFRALKAKGLLITILIVGLMVAFTDQFANFFKDTFERPRPCNEDFIEHGRFLAKRCGKYGYFSGHAISSFAVAVLIGNLLKKHYKNIMLWLLIWAAFVTYSRIYIGVHYPGDILTGGIIGVFVGYGLYRLHLVLQRKFKVKAD